MQVFNCDEDDKFNLLKEKYTVALLFDYYSDLLKESQAQILADYFCNDMSLSEIADDKGISRQGVFDTVKRCTKSLYEFEEVLGLAKKKKENDEAISTIISRINNLKSMNSNSEMAELIELLEKDVLRLGNEI